MTDNDGAVMWSARTCDNTCGYIIHLGIAVLHAGTVKQEMLARHSKLAMHDHAHKWTLTYKGCGTTHAQLERARVNTR